MIIFSNTITPRLRYITDFIGKEIGGTAFVLTGNRNDFKNSGDIKINYSNERITADEFWLQPHELLFEKEIRQQNINCFEVNNNKAFFKTNGDLPFDIFAASFYLLSRYEEYLPHEKDKYGRYAHENSLAFKENFLDIPLINIWLQHFKEKLKQRFSRFTIHDSRFTFLPTYDIDEAWSYKHKGWLRSSGAAIKDLLKGDMNKFRLRRQVLNNKAGDPFDSYDWIDNLHQSYKLKPRYFFLVPGKTAKYDRNILPKEAALQRLIKQHADKYGIGVHPSWQSGDDPLLLKKEIQTIENITKLKISASRQHFIRFALPETFRHLTDAGIKEDFSMGYGSINGFRASVASPFYWYDLEKEQTTSLLLYPFCYMEANSFYEQKFNPGQALEEMRHYYNVVKKVNGTLITIWHNTFLGTDEKFKGWRDVYAEFVKEAAE
ncbi:MAG TPA: polysaccharide deacetylase family protein [Chitinophagaceae bacterium]|nr:polysaccharide deacetylase family protein [Chitinophagaceae bacterium]